MHKNNICLLVTIITTLVVTVFITAKHKIFK